MKAGKFAVLTLLAAIFAAQTAFAQPAYKFKKVFETGDAAPVPPQLGSVHEFDFDDQGRVALIADGGLILKSGDQIIPVAAPGDPAPGGGTFFSFTTPSLGPQGQIVFTSTVSFPGTSGASCTRTVASASSCRTAWWPIPENWCSRVQLRSRATATC